MIKWKCFAAKRNRRYGAVFLAGVTALLFLAFTARKALAKTYVITDGDRVLTYTTFATDPEEVLGQAGLELEDEDTYHAGGTDIQIHRAQRVMLNLRGRELEVISQAETVGELFSRLGIELGSGDRLSHGLHQYTFDGMVLRVDRTVHQLETYAVAVPHEVRYCMDATLPEGSREVLIPGSDGELLCTAQVTYTNYQETSRSLLSQTMTAAPVTEVVAVGTGTLPGPPDPEGMPEIGDGYIRLPTGEVLTYYDTAQVRATAYTHTDEGCDFITYTGTRVHVGTVAVDPRFIPYGTRMFIVSNDGAYIYGISVAEDCGGAIKRDRIDLYFPTYNECIQFGRRNCTIYFLG